MGGTVHTIKSLFNWLFRCKKKTVTITAPVGAGKTASVTRPVRSPVSRHQAGGKVDPNLFKDAKLSKPEIPHSDPASPFYPYWLDAQTQGIQGFGVDQSSIPRPHEVHHHHVSDDSSAVTHRSHSSHHSEHEW